MKYLQRYFLWFFLGLVGVFPLIYTSQNEFTGTDQVAQEQILHNQPQYQPWLKPIWSPPGTEIESLLFALQAALGTGLVAYTLGYYNGKKLQDRHHDT